MSALLIKIYKIKIWNCSEFEVQIPSTPWLDICAEDPVLQCRYNSNLAASMLNTQQGPFTGFLSAGITGSPNKPFTTRKAAFLSFAFICTTYSRSLQCTSVLCDLEALWKLILLQMGPRTTILQFTAGLNHFYGNEQISKWNQNDLISNG